MYKITCCSTCDLKAEKLSALGVEYAKYHYILDGKDFPDDLYTTKTPETFYGEIDAGAMPTTSQVTCEELVGIIEPLLKEGFDVLHLEFSSGLSGGWQSTLAAQKILSEKYPERKIYIVDTLAASSGYGLLVDKACELKAGGMGIDELKDWLEKNKLKLRHWFFTTNLAHFKRGGRVSGAAAAVGTLLNICPVLDVNSEGKLIVRKKVMGKKKAESEILRLMKETAKDGLDYGGKCFISHSRVGEDAARVARLVEEAFPNLDGKVLINDIGTVIGSHTGPGTVALFFFGERDREI